MNFECASPKSWKTQLYTGVNNNLDIQMPNAVDATHTRIIFDGGLDGSFQADQAEKKEGGKQQQRKHEEGCAQLRDLPDQCQSHQSDRDRANKEVGTAGRLGSRYRSCRL